MIEWLNDDDINLCVFVFVLELSLSLNKFKFEFEKKSKIKNHLVSRVRVLKPLRLCHKTNPKSKWFHDTVKVGVLFSENQKLKKTQMRLISEPEFWRSNNH